MLNDQFASTSHATTQDDDQEDEQIREIHALTPPRPPTSHHAHNHRSSSLSMGSTDGASSENFTSMSREFSALVLAGSSIDHNNNSPMMTNGHDNGEGGHVGGNNNLGRIGEEDLMEETNPLAIVPDNHPLNPVPSPRHGGRMASGGAGGASGQGEEVSVQRVKKEEVDAKISAWQNAKIAKINNRFKREDAVIKGWESEQVQKATSWMKKVEVTFFLLKVLFACFCFFMSW